MLHSFTIDNRWIGPDHPVYVIAELSGNHNGNLDRALALMEAAKNAGADAIKLQTYTADTMTIDHNGPGFRIRGGLWDGRTLYNLYQEASTPWLWHEALFAKGHELGITVFSSPFDETSVEFLEKLNAPAYKIASSENVDIPLIERVSTTGKPVIISTGMANSGEIEDAITAARQAGCQDLTLLHCVSAYPAPPEDMNLAVIPDLVKRYGIAVGLSDHTMGTAVAVASVALGAVIIEKHVTLARVDGGVDSNFSLEPQELATLVADIKTAKLAVGEVKHKTIDSEKPSLIFRRSLYVVEDVGAGEVLTSQNIRSIRPGYGLPPKYFKQILGRRAVRNLSRGEPLSQDMLTASPQDHNFSNPD